MKEPKLPESIEDLVKNVLRENPPNPEIRRVPSGYWAESAKVVRALVLAGYAVSESVRLTLDKVGLTRHPRNQSGLRAAYYQLLKSEKDSTHSSLTKN